MNVRRWMTLFALVALAAGCADSIVAPEAGHPEASVVLLSEHTWEQGNTVRGHYAPTVTTGVVGDAVELCAEWTDFANFEPEDPHVYSFDVELQDGEEWLELGSAGGQGSPPMACFTTDPLDPGVYTFRVKGMANLPTGGTPPYSPHHTEYWEGDVAVGQTLRFEALIRNNPSNDFADHAESNGNGNTWNFEFSLRLWDAVADDFVAVSDCTTFPWDEITTVVVWDEAPAASASEELSFRDPECTEPEDPLDPAIYKVSITNSTSDNDRSGSIVFTIEGVENENEVTFSMGQKPGGGRRGG